MRTPTAAFAAPSAAATNTLEASTLAAITTAQAMATIGIAHHRSQRPSRNPPKIAVGITRTGLHDPER
jgi:hypothetical protein